MVAAMNSHYTVVKLLLAAKANPNLPDSYSHAGNLFLEWLVMIFQHFMFIYACLLPGAVSSIAQMQ